jgi:transcriptional regulator with XRE-family HTH domain
MLTSGLLSGTVSVANVNRALPPVKEVHMPKHESTSSLREQIDALGAAHRTVRHERDEADRNLRALASQLARQVAEAHDELFVDADDPDYYDEELIELSADYLVAPDDSGTLPADIRQLLRDMRSAKAADFDQLLSAARLAEQNAIVPARDFADGLRIWMAGAKNDPSIAAQWNDVLARWRTALNLTVREAASALQVSPSAITRYESGARTPSLPQLTALVEAMGSWDPIATESALGRSGRRLAEVVGWDPDSIADRIDEADSERHHLQGLLEDIARDQHFSAERLRTLVALAQNPEALDHVRALAALDLVPTPATPSPKDDGEPTEVGDE